MDPEKTLEIMLTKALKIMSNSEPHFSTTPENDDAYALAEAVINMNDWLVNGGFLPELWRNKIDTSNV